MPRVNIIRRIEDTSQHAKRHALLALACALVLSWPATLAAQDATPQASPSASPVAAVESGSLLAVMDVSVDPGRDFLRYATGGWQDRTVIPADEAYFGVAQEVEDLTIEQLLGLLDRLAAGDQLPAGSDEWKAVQLYAQAVDMETRNAQGMGPIAGDLAAIAALSSLEEYYAFLRDAVLTTYVSGLFGINAAPDFADSSIYTAWYYGPVLGLPNRDYYWVDDPGNEAIREVYRATSADLLELSGYDEAAARDAAERVYAFEKRLAEPLLRPVDFNDPRNYYNPRPVADLVAANPDFDWPGLLALLGIPEQETVVVTEMDYLQRVDGIVRDTDLETLKDYLTLQVLWSTAASLTEETAETAFALTTALSGVEEQAPLEERALGAVNGALGFALGKLYVDEYFPPEAKAEIEALSERLVAAARTRIESLTWMTPETKEAALAKLDTLRLKVGYPDTWRTYEGVTIGVSYAQTLLSANIAEYKRDLARIGKPVDRDEWETLPQVVNAFYNATNNELIFPAGFLQPPFFDYQADPAYNYGAIGATIGHEITHGFDQRGSQFDSEGNLVDWWTPADYEEFASLMETVAEQYGAIEVRPGLFVDGDLTIGENIADMGGLQIAYDGLQAALAESGDPGLVEGLTQDQRFFISYAYSWAEEARDQALVTQLQTDEHAPSETRAVQPARNMDEFHDAFDIEPGDPMYLPPEERIVIW